MLCGSQHSGLRTEARGDAQDDQLHGVAKGDVQQGADRVAHLVGDALGGEAEQAGERDDGERVHGEDDCGRHAGQHLDDYADGHEDEEDVEPRVEHDAAERLGEPLGEGLGRVLLVLAGAGYDRPRPRSFRRCSR